MSEVESRLQTESDGQRGWGAACDASREWITAILDASIANAGATTPAAPTALLEPHVYAIKICENIMARKLHPAAVTPEMARMMLDALNGHFDKLAEPVEVYEYLSVLAGDE